MNCSFALGATDCDVVICKLVTGELVVGKLVLTTEKLMDVGLIIPRDVKDEKSDKNKFAFYIVPYGFPMAQTIINEELSLVNVVKVFAPLGGFEDVVTMYNKITAKEVEHAAEEETINE